MHLGSCAYVMSKEYKTRGCRFVCLFRSRGKKIKELYVHTWVFSLNGCSFFWLICLFRSQRKKQKIVPKMVVGLEREREREVLKLGLTKSSFVYFFCLFRKEIQQGSMLSHTWSCWEASWLAHHYQWSGYRTLLWHVWGPAKGHMTIKVFPHFQLLVFFLWSLQASDFFVAKFYLL
jgi:hypothetical protein